MDSEAIIRVSTLGLHVQGHVDLVAGHRDDAENAFAFVGGQGAHGLHDHLGAKMKGALAGGTSIAFLYVELDDGDGSAVVAFLFRHAAVDNNLALIEDEDSYRSE